jgi:hypothetical protein
MMDRIVTLAATIKAAAAALVVGSLLGAWGAWQVQGWRLDAQEASFTKAINEARNRQEATADEASSNHAQHTEAIRAEAQIIYREVPRVVEKPVYRNVCIDPVGLQLISRAIRGAGGASEPAPAVPGSAGAD